MAGITAHHPPARQRGIVMMAMLALVLMATSGVLLVGLRNAAQNQTSSDQTTTRALAAARAALIGWAVAEPDFPGGLPLPDRNGDGNYDGTSDCTSVTSLPAGTPTPDIAIGRLPWLGLGANCQSNTTLGGLSGNLRDGAGEGLWYAVSANLLRVGNGSNVVQPRVDWSAPFASPPFNWLTVLDANGNVVSNRVAFVVMAPGAPVWRGDLAGTEKLQDRSAAAPNADRYLDRFTVGGTTYDNADSDGVFVIAPDNTRGPEGAPSGTDGFNDRLVYVTVDELLPLLVPRVLRVAGDALLAYETAHGRMPWAAPFADPAVSVYKSTVPVAPPTQRFGLLPLMLPPETFSTPFTVSWGFMSATNVVIPYVGTVTADMMNSTGAMTTFTPPGNGTCVWEFEYRANCSNPAVASVTVNNGAIAPWGAACAATQCQRQYNLTSNVLIQELPELYTNPTGPAAPGGAEPRRRTVTNTKPRTPSSNFGVQVVDYTCTAACPGGAVEVGRGTLAIGPVTNGILSVSGMRHEFSVVDRVVYPPAFDGELPHWFITAGWHRRILLAVASGREPGGAGDCTPGTDCLTVDTLDGTGAVSATVNDVRTLLVYGGWPIAANGGLSTQPSFYFEADNADTDERFTRPGSIAIRNTLDAAGIFNDQMRVVSP